MVDLSVVIPVYRAEACLTELHRRVTAAVLPITKDFEIIFVEDCGGDDSWPLIAQLAQEDSRVKGLQLSRNFGQHYAITAGLDHSSGEAIVVMDCDLQDTPEEIPRLYAKLKEGFDVVVARRQKRTDSAIKLASSALFYKLFRYLSDIPYDGRVGNFRLISRKVADIFVAMPERLRFFGPMVDWMGFPMATVDVRHGERFAGESSYSYRKLFGLARNAIIAYSNKPLRIAVNMGIGISAVSFALGSHMIVRKFTQGIPVAGWTSIIVSIYFMGGLTVTLLGVIGIYLGETFDAIKRRPLYLVARSTSNPISTPKSVNFGG